MVPCRCRDARPLSRYRKRPLSRASSPGTDLSAKTGPKWRTNISPPAPRSPGRSGQPDFQCPTTRAQTAAHQRLQAAAPGIPRLNSTSRRGAIPPAASAATSVASGESRWIRPDTDTKDPGRSWFRRAHGGSSGQRNRERPRLDRLDEVGRWWLSCGAGGDPTLVHAAQPSLEGGIRRRAQSRSARKQLLQSIEPRWRLRQRAGQARVMCELQ